MTKITCLVFAASLAQAASFDITQYGAVGNGTTLASSATNKATGFARATENVTITNCQVSGYDNGTFLDGTYQRKTFDKPNSAGPTGRIKFGTESNGGFKNITISNSAFDYCRGLALESVDGGPIEDITISNVTMRDIVKSPIFLRDIRRVNIAKFVVYNAYRRYSSIISGIPGHDIEDVNLSNIRIIYKGRGMKEQAAVKAPENETMYPEPRMFGVTPAYGFFIRHVKGIELDNVDVSYQQEDQRPPFLFEHVTEAEMNHVTAEHAAGVPVVRLEDVNGFSTHNSPWAADIKLGRVDEKQF